MSATCGKKRGIYLSLLPLRFAVIMARNHESMHPTENASSNERGMLLELHESDR